MKSTRQVYALLLLTTLIASMIFVYVRVSSASSPTIYLEIPTTIQVCDNFTVNVTIANVTELYAFQFKLHWNPTHVEFVSIAEGSFLNSGGTTSWNYNLNETSSWVFAAANLEPIGGVNGSGTLANITFHCIGAGVSALNLSRTMLVDSSPQSVPWNGYGDATGDGSVDAFDATEVATHWLSSVGDPQYDPNSDFDSDGYVDWYDIVCVKVNWGSTDPDPSLIPMRINHTATDGLVTQSPREFPITWNWLDGLGDPVWYTVYANFSEPCQIQDFSFNHTLDHLSFSITSATAGVCNVTIPRRVGSYGSCMDGAFKVLVDNNQVACMLTWNTTHTLIQFNYSSGTHSVEIVGQDVTKIKGDITKDGIVDLFDAILLASHFGWEEP